MGFAEAMAVAMVVDALVGWPNPLFARIGHPVTWLGRLIAALDATIGVASDMLAVAGSVEGRLDTVAAVLEERAP